MTIDRLSDLPDEILILILFHVEIQDAVRTCILSKRWTRLWTQLPSLDINVDSFDDLDSFRFFLLGLFNHYDASNLYSCRFVSSRDDLDHKLVAAVIDYTTSNEVTCLWIHCRARVLFKSASQLSTCKSLVFLSLEDLTLEFPVPFYSDSLRKVFLHGVNLVSDIVLGCMNLENFSMEGAVYGSSKIIIFSPQLTKLDIRYERLYDFVKEMWVYISAPRLESFAFHFGGDPLLKVFVDKCPNLDCAWIDFYDELTIGNTEEALKRHKDAKHLVSFLEGVSDVRSLTFSAGTMKVLCEFPELVKNLSSPFHNLKSLEVHTDVDNQSVVIPPEVVTFFVGGSPNGSEIRNGLHLESTK